jgi:thiol-disulfide isomerase/thioredoxin
MRTRILSMLAAIMLLASGAFAQDAKEPKLKVGDPAPPLGEGKWVKGDPVSEFESGKVYVIEFWATWCGPCIAAIPHVTELQKKYEDKGVVIIGQNVWETDPAKVDPFVKEMGDKMGYRVVMDEPSGDKGYMAENWMAAAGRNGIPCSFIVNQDGKIAWIGHPMAMEPVLEKVVAGKYDPAAARAEAEKAQRSAALMSKLRTLANEGKWDELYAEADKGIEEIEDPMALNEIAWRIVDPEQPFPVQNLDVAMKAATKANELTESKSGAILDTLARVYWVKGDKKKALELQEKAVEVNDEPQFSEELAERLEEYRRGQDKAE